MLGTTNQGGPNGLLYCWRLLRSQLFQKLFISLDLKFGVFVIPAEQH